MGLSSCSVSSPVRKVLTTNARRPVQVLRCRLSADLGTKAAETLRCARSGGPGPSAEAAALRGTGGTENERRCGGGAESAGWREVAEWCHAAEGVGHE
jgi:hypothetical protein